MDVSEETRLISQAQSGDRDAFGELVNGYHKGVINVVYRMCGDKWLAQDAAQTAFIKAWKNLPSYRSGTSFRNWLYRIAVNAAVDIVRKDKQTIDINNLELKSPHPGIEDNLETMERQQIVRKAVLDLPKASRAVLILREYEDLTYREIAETLDIPTGTVMSRLNYARQRLSETLRPLLEEQ